MTATLLAALILVESNGNPSAIGDNGRAVGILQITEACVMDVNRLCGTNFKWPADCLDPETSKVICALYLAKRGGGNASDERLARCWNGGPRGHLKSKTLPYWRKVQSALK